MNWPTEEAKAVDVWFGPHAVVQDLWPSQPGGCDPKPEKGQDPIPEGLRGKATLVYGAECGEKYLMVRYQDGGNRVGRIVRIEDVTLKAPKNVWDTKPALRSTPIGLDGKALLVIPLDDPAWTFPHALVYAEPVDVLDEQARVVRDANGHELSIPAYAFPTVDRPHASVDRAATEKAPRMRMVAGKAKAEAVAPISRVPASTELIAHPEWKGRTYWFEFEPDDLTSDRRFSADWLDPTGQTMDHTCEDALRWDEIEPCGRYWLDYTAFGAWWPTAEVDVLGIYDGVIDRNGEKLPALRLVVKHPFESSVRVSPAWDGKDPGQLQSAP